LSNTLLIGGSIALFGLIGPGASLWAIVPLSCVFGYCSSLQYTSMNTLVYADVKPAGVGMASTILSSVQQLAISFGVAGAGLLTVLFIPDRLHASPLQLVHGLHLAFVLLGALTAVSALIFRELRAEDGDKLSLHQAGLGLGH
ncbi:MAG: MFS transporter, partial [bacterium]